MLTEEEKEELAQARENGNPLSESLKNSVVEAIRSGEFYEENLDTICCKYRNGPNTEYDKMTTKDCLEIFFGEVVDNGKCS